MKTLNQTILDAARDEVAKRDYNTPFRYVVENGTYSSIMRVMEEAALLAMEKQYNFLRWLPKKGYRQTATGLWWNRNTLEKAAELELYEIWEGQK